MKYYDKIVLFIRKTFFRMRQKNRLVNDINGFSFEEIKVLLKGMKVTIFNKTYDGFKARFSDSYTEYVLSFDNLGIVEEIELEYWKDMDVKFGIR